MASLSIDTATQQVQVLLQILTIFLTGWKVDMMSKRRNFNTNFIFNLGTTKRTLQGLQTDTRRKDSEWT